MEYAINNMPEYGMVVEIGSFAGLSANVLLHLLNKYKKEHELICVDAWIYEGYNDYKNEAIPDFIDGREDVSRKEYSTYIREAFKNSLKLFQPNRLPYAFHAKSTAFFEAWDKEELTDVFGRSKKISGNISFCYIDGDHSYQASKEDFEHCYKYMLSGGFVLLDDSADNLRFGSCRLAQELSKDERLELVNADENYLFRKK